MDVAKGVLEDRLARAFSVKEAFQDLAAVLKRGNYEPTPDDARAMQECVTELARLSKTELAAGAAGGFLLGSMVKQRAAATLLGMFLCYQQRDRQPAADRCLQRVMSLPTPMGAEMVEIVKSRDANHPLLSHLPDRNGLPGRIATPEATGESHTHSITQEPSAKSPASGHGLWDLSDPFDLCYQQPTDGTTPRSNANNATKPSKAQVRKDQRQALYMARRQARKQHQEGQLVDDPWT